MTQPTALPQLNAKLLQKERLFGNTAAAVYPEKVLQFGEGVFLRAFADWMIEGMNRKELFGGSVVVVQPLPQGMIEKLNEQDGLYTLVMRGVQNGKTIEEQEIISSISRGINPYTHFRDFLQCAHNPELRWIISNTTEAGIAYNAGDKLTDRPPSSYPGKLTVLLLERYKAFRGNINKGFVILPCELSDRNGDNLKKTVLQTAHNWQLEAGFLEWIEKANVFANTAVDRIVTGYPKDEAEAMWASAGCRDSLLDCGEPFHLWVIEAPAHLEKEFPLRDAGFNVIWTDDMTPYRDRKVRILNGAHTSSSLAAYLAGEDTVGEMMKNPLTGGFMKRAIYEEVIPTLTLPEEELAVFAEAVFERFSNPFIKHGLLNIALNSVSKFRARVLPSLQEYAKSRGDVPPCLAFSLASLIAFYRGTEIRNGALMGSRGGKEYLIQDSQEILKTFAELWSGCDGSNQAVAALAGKVLANQEWWGSDLRDIPKLADAVSADLQCILQCGMIAALAGLSRSIDEQPVEAHGTVLTAAGKG